MPADPRRLLALTGSAALVAAAITVAAPAGRAAADALPFTNCGTNSAARVSAVDVDPSPLQPGRNVDLTLRGSLSEKVTRGSYDVRVTYLGAPLLHTSGDLADVVHLPLPAGTFSLHKKVKVPSEAPSGKYNLTLTAADQHHDQLLCVRVPFEVR
jgi:uncharacterized membrane protein